jgi:hypothetical protein
MARIQALNDAIDAYSDNASAAVALARNLVLGQQA